MQDTEYSKKFYGLKTYVDKLVHKKYTEGIKYRYNSSSLSGLTGDLVVEGGILSGSRRAAMEETGM